MAILIGKGTKLSACRSLGDQIRVYAMRLGGGWAEAREELATMAEDWFGREPAKKRADFSSVCREVFRQD